MRRGEPIAGLGGVALLVSLSLTWWSGFDGDWVAWDRIGGTTRVLLVGFGLLFIAVPVVSVTTKGPAKAIATAVLAGAFGWIPIVLVGLELLFPYNGDELRGGGWFALVAAIVAWVGSWLALRDESTPGARDPQLIPRPLPDAPR